MFALLVIVAGVAAGVGALLLVAGRGHRYDEVERFHVARRLTTEWAQRGVTRPVVADLDDNAEERSRG